MLKEIIDLPGQCIYGLINKLDQKIFIGYTKDLVTALNRIAKDIKSSNHVLKKDIDNIKLVILETIQDESLLRSRYQFWYNQYSNMGFLHYRKYKALGSYKLFREIVLDKQGHVPKIHVSLRYGRSKRVLVGIFSSVPECDEFVNQYYPNKKDISCIIYSSNKLTKDYLSNAG